MVQSPVGLVVIPARCTRRDWISMKNRTWRRRSVMVSTQQKSVATILFACEWMNSIHVGPVLPGVGLIPAVRRNFHIDDGTILWPSRRSSPWMRR